jgi:SSS family solute:Na+ symporter
MSIIDWIVLGSFLLFIVVYGIWKSRGSKDMRGYFLANRQTPWYVVTLSIMATQASAITFLSTPGQAFVDGMRFVQFYLGLPLAMIVLSITAVPIYHRLNVYTAYEYLESRFDLKNRILAGVLFLIQRGLAAGFTIFAPALVISVLLGWRLDTTIIIIGSLVVLYTASGGTEAVNKTHMLQMIVIFFGMMVAFFMLFNLMPADISFFDALHVAGKMEKLNVIDFTFDLSNRYNIWSGLLGGTFLMLSYFGTDQSQVQRYLAGSSIAQSRTALLANGIVKIPMQFFILFLGAMVFVFYQFTAPPLFFNPVSYQKVKEGPHALEFIEVEERYHESHELKENEIESLLAAMETDDERSIEVHSEKVREIEANGSAIRAEGIQLIKKTDPDAETNDVNYIFLSFVLTFLPMGVIGLVLAAIISASMSSTSAELNALASTTVIDIYKRLIKKEASDRHYLIVSKLSTIFWGIYAIFFALFANRLGSLIEAVNILGSLFYGTILGIFLVAFYFKRIGGTATFIGALLAEVAVFYCYIFTDISFLWFNLIGCVLVVVLGFILEVFLRKVRQA